MKNSSTFVFGKTLLIGCFAVLIIGLYSTVQAQPVNVWTQVGENISTVGGFGSGAAIAVSQDNEPVIAHLSRVRIFDADTNTWPFINNPTTEVGDAQVYQHFNASASPDNPDYVYFSFFRNNKAYAHRLDTSNNTWLMLGGASLGGTYNMQSATAIVAGENGSVFVAFRNANASGHITVKQYNPITDTWISLGGATMANGQDQTIDLLPDGTPVIMFRNPLSGFNEVRIYDSVSDTWNEMSQHPLAYLQQPQLAISGNGTIFVATIATNNPLSIADYMFMVHKWDAENEEWITLNGTDKPAFFGTNHTREGSLKMVVNDDDIPFVHQVADGIPMYGYHQISMWNPNTETWQFTHPCIDLNTCGLNPISHNGTFKEALTIGPDGDVWTMIMSGPSEDPIYQVWRYGPEPEVEIVLECSAINNPINSFFPFFSFSFLNEEPINYEILIVDSDGNTVIDIDTNTLGTTHTHSFTTYSTPLAHLGEYEFSVTPVFNAGPGVTVTCDIVINVPVIYVDARYPEPSVQFGNSWNTPFSSFSTALDFVVSGQQIYVAQGTYIVPGLKDRSFEIQNLEDVNILGGFEGGDWVGNPTPGNRDWVNNPTILSGDRFGDDDPNNPFNSDLRNDNTQTIVRVTNVEDTVLMDGFTIYGGNADVPDVADRGAGMFIQDASIQLSNMRFTGNSANGMGGGIYVTGNSSPTITQVDFIENHGNNGGGIAIDGGSTLIHRSFFTQNSGEGAIYVSENGSGSVINSVIHQNQRGIYGSFNEGGTVDVINSTITENSTTGIFANALTVNVYNSIIYGFMMQVDDFVLSSGEINLQNSQVANMLFEGVNDLGGNIIGFDPMFENINNAPAGLALTPFSPAVNAGSNGLLPVEYALDFAGQNRIFNGMIDMGAFELQDDPIGQVLFENFISVSDDTGGNKNLIFGIAENATDGYDAGLDQLAPPMPPIGAFDARFVAGSPQAGFFSDFRGSGDPIVWTMHMQPRAGASQFSLFWSSSAFYMIEGSFTLSYGNPATEIDMRLNSEASFSTDITTATITYRSTPDFELDVTYAEGWNLISTPVQWEPDPLLVFNSAEPGTLFGFNQAYTDETNLIGGRGYWLLLNESETVTFTEDPFASLTITLNEGWNLIGSLADEVSVSEIEDVENIVVPGSVYGFNAESGYVAVSTIEPGKAYWLRTTAFGNITLQSGSESLGQLASNEPQYPGFHVIEVQNEQGTPKQFFMGGFITDDMPPSHAYELPPLPPLGAFDIRFQNHTWLTELRETAMLVQSPGQNLTFNYQAAEGEEGSVLEMNIQRTGQPVESYLIAHGDELQLDGTGIFRIEVSVNVSTGIPHPERDLPMSVELSQNYPNPFNPTTNISFALPQSGDVRIEVYNIQGQKVATLITENKPAGRHSITFDASRLASGVYIYRMQVTTGEGSALVNEVFTRKMTLIK